MTARERSPCSPCRTGKVQKLPRQRARLGTAPLRAAACAHAPGGGARWWSAPSPTRTPWKAVWVTRRSWASLQNQSGWMATEPRLLPSAGSHTPGRYVAFSKSHHPCALGFPVSLRVSTRLPAVLPGNSGPGPEL